MTTDEEFKGRCDPVWNLQIYRKEKRAQDENWKGMANPPRYARRCRALLILNERSDSGDMVGLKCMAGSEDSSDQDFSTDSSSK
jgi:hypothetical protein